MKKFESVCARVASSLSTDKLKILVEKVLSNEKYAFCFFVIFEKVFGYEDKIKLDNIINLSLKGKKYLKES